MKNIINEYPYLKEIKSEKCEHTEVSEEIVNIYKTKYDFLEKYKFNKYNKKRNQMTTSGAWLSKNNEDEKYSIDIVGDVLTTVSVFKFIDENSDLESIRLFKIFKDIYHTVGNYLPIGEGGNLGGKVGTDNFSRKLYLIKQIFNNEKKDGDSLKDDKIREKIEHGKSLRSSKSNLHYWIKTEWIDKNKNWDDFIVENYLNEMVDENKRPIYWGKNEFNWDLKNLKPNELNIIIAYCIRMIIYRGYRVCYKCKSKK
ncbi:conserved domain protein [Parvimonas sp. oral taxon 393 str. F0440]|nr:conserved domain protein [Parvimonas sp. oral taxon 393 str. F0440]